MSFLRELYFEKVQTKTEENYAREYTETKKRERERYTHTEEVNIFLLREREEKID